MKCGRAISASGISGCHFFSHSNETKRLRPRLTIRTGYSFYSETWRIVHQPLEIEASQDRQGHGGFARSRSWPRRAQRSTRGIRADESIVNPVRKLTKLFPVIINIARAVHQQRGPEFSSNPRHRDRRRRNIFITDGFCNYCGTASSKRCFEKSADKCATGPRTVPKSFPLT